MLLIDKKSVVIHMHDIFGQMDRLLQAVSYDDFTVFSIEKSHSHPIVIAKILFVW